MSVFSAALLTLLTAASPGQTHTWEACFDGDVPTPEAFAAFREAGRVFRDAGRFGARATLAGSDQSETAWSEAKLTAYVELLRAGVSANYLSVNPAPRNAGACLPVTVEVLPPAQNPPGLWHLRPVYGFEPGSAEIRSFGARAAVRIAAAVYEPGWVIRLDGHTDTVGSEEDNLALSLRRAEAVAEALVREGVHWKAIEIHGRGESQLARPTADDMPEPLNRRVNIDYRPPPATPH
ncbi:OmpA family protein [Brevundimonas basaltis]|uniref:Outer membrane protein OmpA-like peptidoglycan-associated protein n=1 Tax=Brevundimonas basaltis TaxID=472166 RepID=A0A7W8HW50_9CAUL|nr:OmpA family protein [Brevundimonas basaltis]MBB5290784.1 outer membrane protein OmpA-like peptidoglycan-associated protein [Brevundimonas basaltis]